MVSSISTLVQRAWCPNSISATLSRRPFMHRVNRLGGPTCRNTVGVSVPCGDILVGSRVGNCAFRPSDNGHGASTLLPRWLGLSMCSLAIFTLRSCACTSGIGISDGNSGFQFREKSSIKTTSSSLTIGMSAIWTFEVSIVNQQNIFSRACALAIFTTALTLHAKAPTNALHYNNPHLPHKHHTYLDTITTSFTYSFNLPIYYLQTSFLSPRKQSPVV